MPTIKRNPDGSAHVTHDDGREETLYPGNRNKKRPRTRPYIRRDDPEPVAVDVYMSLTLTTGVPGGGILGGEE